MTATAQHLPMNVNRDSLALKFANGTVLDMPLGDVTLISGMQHNYATGMIYSALVHFCMLNQPISRVPGKTPLIIVLDQETEPTDSMMWMYRYIKENLEDIPVDPQDIDPKEITDYVDRHLTRNGFAYGIVRVDHDGRSLAPLLANLEAMYPEDDYDLHAIMMDPARNILANPEAVPDNEEAIPYNLGVFRDFCQRRGAAGIVTTHFTSNVRQYIRERGTRDDFERTTINDPSYLECGEKTLELVDNQLVIVLQRKEKTTWLNYSYHQKATRVTAFGKIKFEEMKNLPFYYPAD